MLSLRRMAAFAVLRIGFCGDLEFALADADKLQVARFKEAADMVRAAGTEYV